jgi:tetratricopeptide (TPR) repeat protein
MGIDEPLVPGTAIGGFTIGEPIGEGGFGRVYRARADSGTEVAVKVSKPSHGSHPTQRLIWLQNEVEALMRLRHPSLVKLESYGFLETGALYIAMELVEGERLDRYLARRGRLETIEALRLMQVVAEALAHCHDHGVLHLDLKPQNIVVTDPHEPRIKMLDFGLARVHGAWRASDAPLRAATLAYLAPECLDAERATAMSPEVDLYALGTIFYQLMTGRLPYEGTFPTVWKRKSEDDLVPLAWLAPSVPESVAALVHALIAAAPHRRGHSAARLAMRLHELYFQALRGSDPTTMVRHLDLSGPQATPDGRDVAFVGRADELALVTRRVEEVRCGAGRVVFLTGDAGIGKSRLLAETLRRIEREGDVLIAYGRCRELGALVPYSALREALSELATAIEDSSGPVGEALRRAVRDALAEEGALLVGLVPELGTLAPRGGGEDVPVLRMMGPRHVGQAVTRLLAGVARVRRVVLAIEDLHGADDGTRQVLARLVDPVPAGVLVLGTSRPESGLPEGLRTEVVALSRLGPQENDALIAGLAADADAPLIEGLKRSVPLLGAGNPLFITQVMRQLELQGHIVRGADGVRLSAEIQRDFVAPDSVSAALQRAVDLLGRAALEVLAVGALAGRAFSVADVKALDLFAAEHVDEAVAVAECHFLCRRRGDRVSFVHDAIREHVALAVTPERARVVHGRIASLLTSRGGPWGTLAHHREGAGDVLGAAEAYYEAGEEAHRLHDSPGACRHLERALDLATALPAGRERDALMLRAVHKLTHIGALIDQTTRTLAYLHRCSELLRDAGDEANVALDSAYARVLYVQGDFAGAIARSRRCLSRLGDAAMMRAYQCAPTAVMGSALCASGRFGAAVETLSRACELAEESMELCYAQGVLSVALGYTGDHTGALACVTASEHMAQRLGDPVRLLAANFYYAVLGETRFDWELGVKYTSRLLAYAQEQRLGGLYLYTGTLYAGRHQFHVGHLERARVLLINALNLGRVLGISLGEGWAYGFLGDVHFVAGRLEEARRHYRKGMDIASTGDGDEYAAGLCLAGLCHCAARLDGDQALVARLGDEATRRLKAAGNLSVLLGALQRQAEAQHEGGASEAAQAHMAEHDALAERLGVTPRTFWPRVPRELRPAWDELARTHRIVRGAPMTPREFWTALAQPDANALSTLGQEALAALRDVSGGLASAPLKGERGGGAAAGAPPAAGTDPTVDLLGNMATVEGFVPPYAGAMRT